MRDRLLSTCSRRALLVSWLTPRPPRPLAAPAATRAPVTLTQPPSAPDPIWVGTRLPFERVRRNAVLVHQYWHQNGKVRRPRPHPEVIDRLTLRYARHSLTRYDDLRQGLSPAECDALRKRINTAIVARYPELVGAVA